MITWGIPMGVEGATFSVLSKLLAKDGFTGDRFGGAIGIYDRSALIGAYADSDKASSAGIPVLYAYNIYP